MSPAESQPEALEGALPLPPVPETGGTPASERLEFERIYHQFAPTVRGIALQAGSRSPDDVSQEVFRRAWDGRSGINNLCGSWFNTTTRRVVCDEWRRGPRDLLVDPEATIAPDIHKVTEQRVVLAKALSQIPSALKEVVGLIYFQDMSIKQAAEALSVPENTVKSRAAQGRAALRKTLGGMGINSLGDIL